MNDRRVVWMRFAIVAIAMAWSVAAVVAQCWLSHPQRHAFHPNHPLAAAVGNEFAVNTDHAHLSDNSTPPCPLDFASAPLPQAEATAFASYAVAVGAGAAQLQHHLVVPAGRGPPDALGLARSGQELLTHYCLARR